MVTEHFFKHSSEEGFCCKVVEVKLHYVHDIQLFKLGEQFRKEPQVMPILWRNNTFKAA